MISMNKAIVKNLNLRENLLNFVFDLKIYNSLLMRIPALSPLPNPKAGRFQRNSNLIQLL
jgi:hypothetical protein